MDEMQIASPQRSAWSAPWRIVGWLCVLVIAGSLLACVGLATARSTALTRVTVTALDPAKEPRDHRLPLIKQKDALPDYAIVLQLTDGSSMSLGTFVNVSAMHGLAWPVPGTVSVADVASVRLQETDTVVSDALAEVRIVQPTVDAHGYRFAFTTERSFEAGIRSFFGTPIGTAIVVAFGVAVLMLLARIFAF